MTQSCNEVAFKFRVDVDEFENNLKENVDEF
jgi:hypothetical protein